MNSIIKICCILLLVPINLICGPGEDNTLPADGIHIDEQQTKNTFTEQEKALASRQKQERNIAKNKAKIDGKVVKRSMEYKQLKLQQSSEVIALHEIKFQHSLVSDALKAAKAVETNYDTLKRYQSKYKPDTLENNLRQAVNRINKAHNKAHQALTQAIDLHAKANCPEAVRLLDSAQKDFSQICDLKNNIEGFYEQVCQEISFKQVESQDSDLNSALNSESQGQTDSLENSQKSDLDKSPARKNFSEM